MTRLADILETMQEQLSDATTLKEFARRAMEALEDGEALAALGYTDEDQAVIEQAHEYYRQIVDAEMTADKFTMHADGNVSFNGTMAYHVSNGGKKVIFRLTGKEIEMPQETYCLASADGKRKFFEDLIAVEKENE